MRRFFHCGGTTCSSRHFPPETILANYANLVEHLQDQPKQIGLVLMTTPPDFPRGVRGIELISTPQELENEVSIVLDKLKLNHLRPDLSTLNWTWWNPKVWLTDKLFLEIRPVLNWANTGLAHCQVTPTNTGTCGALRDKMGILVNGDVVLCCVDCNAENVLGNVADQELNEILNSPLALDREPRGVAQLSTLPGNPGLKVPRTRRVTDLRRSWAPPDADSPTAS